MIKVYGSNTFSFNDYSELSANVEVRMEQRDSGLFQVAYINGVPRRAQRFGVVMGAGRKAQSYLYWRGNQLLQLPFSFEQGDTLSNYFGAGPAVDTGHAEVHGNQYGLLAASKCFIVSGTMECRTCHSRHQEESGNMAAFSQRCMSCHSSGAMVKLHGKGGEIVRDCVDCHMPVQASSIVTLMVPGKKELAPLFVRNHRIAIYR